MRVLRGNPSIKVPVWNSYFVAEVPEFLYKIVKGSKSKFTSAYHRSLRLLEVDKPTLDFMLKQCDKYHISVTFEGEERAVPSLRIFEDDAHFGYQEDAAEVLYGMPNALLQFGVGSGKTRITLLAMQKRFADNPSMRVLVVTGLAALQQNWVSDSEKFGLCTGKIRIAGVGNSKESKKIIAAAGDGDVLTANFDMLSNIELLNALVDFNPNLVVFDEVHMIANVGNKRVSGAMRVEGLHELQGDHWSLSASPVKFSPFDWRSLLVWLRVLSADMSQSAFESYYGEFDLNYMGQRVCTKYRNLECLLPLVNSVRLVFAGTELPKLSLVNVPVLGGDARSAYNIRHYNNCINPNKIEFVRKLGKRCIVACNITKPFDVWVKALEGLRVRVFDGSLNLSQRAELLKECLDGDVDVLLLSLSAGGVGLNLAEAFSDMVFIDCPNSLVDFWQGYGRVHRIGAKKPVTVYKLFCQSTSDEARWKQIYSDFNALKIFYDF